jgi:tetratricopeptide (TPR) repeat protein
MAESKRTRDIYPRIAGYRILAEIGRGGMGVVYKARQRGLKRLVALKVIRDLEDRERFQNEALAVARLQHPNIVQIYEQSTDAAAGPPHLSMEYIAGGNLAQQLAGKPWPAAKAAHLVETLARAIHHAHQNNVAHRDLKPANILLAVVSGQLSVVAKQLESPFSLTTDNWQLTTVPKITDFGLAKLLDRRQHLTQTGSRLGTCAYMAPEQAIARPGIDWHKVDVYGLGAILYETLTGGPPFQSATELETLRQVLESDPVPPRRLSAGVPRDLEMVCLKALEKNPRRRYASAEAMAVDLSRFLAGQPVKARPLGPLGRMGRWCRRKPLAAALLLSLVIGFGASLQQWRRAVVSLAEAQAARAQAEEHFTTLRQVMVNNIQIGATYYRQPSDANPIPETMLTDAESCLAQLLQRRPEDHELRALLADVLTRRGQRQSSNESLNYFENAARLWEELPPEETGQPRHLASRATTYGEIGRFHSSKRRLDQALPALELSFELWKQLAEERSNPRAQDKLFYAAAYLAAVLTAAGHSEDEVKLRFEELRTRPELLGGGQGRDVLWDLLRIEQLCVVAQRHRVAGKQGDGLAAARQAASILDRYYQQTSLARRYSVWFVAQSVSVALRWNGAPEESLRLLERANRWLQQLVREAPEACYGFAELSSSWYHIAKAYWDLGQAEETLAACRLALTAQRQACLLAPAVAEYRQELGTRHVQLARKLCELGRLDEAEACFRERQALWPGDLAKHEEALQELRKWASQVGEIGANVSPEEEQERERYLELCDRLVRAKK